MKTAGRENPNQGGRSAPQPSTWRGGSEQILLHQVGCEARKIPADAEVFFLDFPFYRTYRDLRGKARLLRRFRQDFLKSSRYNLVLTWLQHPNPHNDYVAASR